VDNWRVKFCFEIFLLRCASRCEYLRAGKYGMKIIPTLIYDLCTENDQRAVISFEVYHQHPGLYYHNCYDSVRGVVPVVIEDWNMIKLVDYKLFFPVESIPDYRADLRRDLDRFLMNTQPRKILHLSLDDDRYALSQHFLAKHLKNLKWLGELNVQVVDRTATLDAAQTSSMVAKFFRSNRLAVLEYHRQLLRGPVNSAAVMYDLKSTNTLQHYLHDPPQLTE
jgi:hypothetical protein